MDLEALQRVATIGDASGRLPWVGKQLGCGCSSHRFLFSVRPNLSWNLLKKLHELGNEKRLLRLSFIPVEARFLQKHDCSHFPLCELLLWTYGVRLQITRNVAK